MARQICFGRFGTPKAADDGRIDLVLAQWTAMLLIRSLEVVSTVRDSGHFAVVVSLIAQMVRLT